MMKNPMLSGIVTFVNMIAMGLPISSNLIKRAGEQKIPASTNIIINLMKNLHNPLPTV
jgi:hypothetical protein